MRIYYLSTPSFFQVDKEFVHVLGKNAQLHFGVVVGKNQGNFSDNELIAYCKQHCIDHTIWKLNYRQRDIRLIKIFYRIIKQIKLFNPDVIYIVSFDHPIFSLLALSLNKYKTVVALHDVELHSNFNNAFLHNLSRKITAKHFQSYQVFSAEQAKVFRRKYRNKELFTIPLSLSNYGDQVALPKKAETIRFLFFGKILPYKGLDLLIEAANILGKQGLNFELVIAGLCENWDVLYKPLIGDAEYKLTLHIRYINNDEVPTLFSSVHYLVLPYQDATQSGPLMIAYNYKVPVIASRIEAFEEYVQEGISGYLFDRNAVQNLVAVMREAVFRSSEEYDVLKEKMGNYVSDNFSQVAVVNKYMHMFKTIAVKSKSSI
ncbi:MAG: glycosyltransferase family 4 protein [Agriterribacter sp.]